MHITTPFGELEDHTIHLHRILQGLNLETSMSMTVEPYTPDTQHTGKPATTTVTSFKLDTMAAIREGVRTIRLRMGCDPLIIIGESAHSHDPETIRETLHQLLPHTQFIIASNTDTVLTDTHVQDAVHLTLFAIVDTGRAGVGTITKTGNPTTVGFKAARHACEAAGRDYRTVHFDKPKVVLLFNTSGDEADLIHGIQRCFGKSVMIVGGNASDADFNANHWWLSANDFAGPNCVSVVAMWTSAEIVSLSNYGFSPGALGGEVTRLDPTGHWVEEIDGMPAQEVYNRWTAGAIEHAVRSTTPVVVSGPSTLHPLGRLSGYDENGDEVIQLVHIIKAGTEGLWTFVELEEGDRLILMGGTKNHLVNRVFSLRKPIQEALVQVHGALLFWCAGVLGATHDLLPQLQTHLNTICGGSLMTHFSFGEFATFHLASYEPLSHTIEPFRDTSLSQTVDSDATDDTNQPHRLRHCSGAQCRPNSTQPAPRLIHVTPRARRVSFDQGTAPHSPLSPHIGVSAVMSTTPLSVIMTTADVKDEPDIYRDLDDSIESVTGSDSGSLPDDISVLSSDSQTSEQSDSSTLSTLPQSLSRYAVDMDTGHHTQFCNLSFNIVVFGASQPALPSGDVTLLFTDIMASTDLWRTDPHGMARALDVHNAVCRDTLRRVMPVWPGVEVKFEGDAFMVAFSDPAHCAMATAYLQLALLSANWPEIDHPAYTSIRGPKGCPPYCPVCRAGGGLTRVDPTPTPPHPHDCPIRDARPTCRGALQYRGLRVRMGFAAGSPQMQYDPSKAALDYLGIDVNMAARISDAGAGGQVLLSKATHDRIKDADFSAVGGLRFKSLGTYDLKGIGPEEIVEMQIPFLGHRDFSEVKLRIR